MRLNKHMVFILKELFLLIIRISSLCFFVFLSFVWSSLPSEVWPLSVMVVELKECVDKQG